MVVWVRWVMFNNYSLFDDNIIQVRIQFFMSCCELSPRTLRRRDYTPGMPNSALTCGTPRGMKYTSHSPVNATANPVNFSNQV